MKKMVALLTLIFYLLAGPANALAEYVCGQDLDGDGFSDGSGETALCTQSGTDWLCPVAAVDCLAQNPPPQCPPGGVFDQGQDVCYVPADAISCPAGYSYDASVDRCVQAVSCPEGGGFNPAADRCEKIPSPSCPAGYVFDGGACIQPIFCPEGTYFPERDRCETAVTLVCPAGFALNPAFQRCEAVPYCPSDMTYHAGRNRCEQPPDHSCPSGYAWDDALGQCTQTAACPAGTILNGTSDQCEALVSNQCPLGYSFNASRNACEKNPTCAAPGAYDGTLDRCRADENGVACPTGYSFNMVNDACVAPAVCVGGVFNPASDQCEASPGLSCPVDFTFNPSRSRCEVSPTCAQGAYNATYDKCLQSFTPTCPSGYVLNAATNRCEKVPDCASGSYNPATNQCERVRITSYTCSLDGGSYPTASQCASGCTQTASCQSLINATGSAPARSDFFYGQGSRLVFERGVIDLGSNATATGGTTNGDFNDGYIKRLWGSNSSLCVQIQYLIGRTYLNKNYCVSVPGAPISGDTGTEDWESLTAQGNAIVAYARVCTRPTRGGCIEWSNLYRSVSLGGSWCPFPGSTCSSGTCSTSGTCSPQTTCPAGTTLSGGLCVSPAACPSGTMDTAADVCYAPYTPSCPSGMTFDTAANMCAQPPNCQGGALDGAADRCYQAATATCPAGMTLTGGLCRAAAACSSPGSLAPAWDVCAATATHSCPSGYTFNASLGACVRTPFCTSPGSLDATTDKCQAVVTQVCPSGTSLAGSVCQALPACTAPGAFSASADLCQAASSPVCPAGTTYAAAADVCRAAANCTGGTLDGAADVCAAEVVRQCPASYTLDTANQVCYSPTVCNLGYLNTAADRCEAFVDQDCGSYAFEAASGKCSLAPSCPDPGLLSSALDMCATGADHSCPSGFSWVGPPTGRCETQVLCDGATYNPDLDQCEGAAETCPLGAQYSCLDTGGGQKQCSPNPCFDLSVPGNDVTELPPEDPMLQNDGEVDEEGNCLGELYIFSGKASRCRPPGLTVGTVNDCCDSDEPALTDSTSGPRINQVVTAVQTVYEVAQVGYYAYSISTGAMAAVEVGGQVVVYNMATGTVAASYGAGSAVGTGVVAAQGAAAGGAAAGGTVSSALTSYMGALLNPTTIAIAIVVMVVMKVLMGSGCDQRDIETALLGESGYCHYVGITCERKWPVVGCVQKAKRFCCFNSKLARIIQEQGRPQLASFGPAGDWGLPANPNCRGFSPEEFQMLDFAKIDLSAYYGDIQRDLAQKIQDAQSNVQQKVQQHYEQIR